MSLPDEMLRALRFARDPRLGEVLSDLGLEGRPPFGIEFVTFHGLFYEPVEAGGEPALIVPVADGGCLCDLAACGLRGRRVATRLRAGLVLGEAFIAQASATQGRLVLYDDPWRWTSARRRGAVLLDWSRAAFLFDGVGEIACCSAALARRVHAVTRRLSDPPRLLFPKPRSFGHAA